MRRITNQQQQLLKFSNITRDGYTSLSKLPRNPTAAETTGNDTNNPLPTPTDFDLDGHTTPN